MNRLKINEEKSVAFSANEAVLIVQSAQGELIPYSLMHTKGIEEHCETSRNKLSPKESHRKKYHKKLCRRLKRELRKYDKENVPNQLPERNRKFVVKVQNHHLPILTDQILIYNKDRRYGVKACRGNQSKMFQRLFDAVDTHGVAKSSNPHSKKSYFYGWIDERERMHIKIDRALAMQPW